MKFVKRLGCIMLGLGLAACSQGNEKILQAGLIEAEPEPHLKNIRQLTFGGENAEAYFSNKEQEIVFQYTNKNDGVYCDQIYTASLNGDELKRKLVSTGKGRTTCAYFLPGDQTIIYASTHKTSEACPETPDRAKIGKYVWPIYNSYVLYITNLDGKIQLLEFNPSDSKVRQRTNHEFDANQTR